MYFDVSFDFDSPTYRRVSFFFLIEKIHGERNSKTAKHFAGKEEKVKPRAVLDSPSPGHGAGEN